MRTNESARLWNGSIPLGILCDFKATARSASVVLRLEVASSERQMKKNESDAFDVAVRSADLRRLAHSILLEADKLDGVAVFERVTRRRWSDRAFRWVRLTNSR
jgi:hypothetical protein